MYYYIIAEKCPPLSVFLCVSVPQQLVAGSGANQDKDESSDSVPAEGEAQEVQADVNAKEDGYSVGVPGPLTRIFVIANRGVANLVQDLILVSFKVYCEKPSQTPSSSFVNILRISYTKVILWH